MKMKKIHSMSLIKRMLVLYLIGPLLLFIMFCLFIIWSMNREMNQKLQISIANDLNRTIHAIDETTNTLMMITEQMAYGYVSTNLSSMLEEDNPYEKSRLIRSIANEVNVISFTNMGIRLVGYYDREEEEFVFCSNGAADTGILPEDIYLFCRNEFQFQGPHVSFARNYNDLVISVMKSVPTAKGIDAYAELVVDLHAMDSFPEDMELVILGEDGRVNYGRAELMENVSGGRVMQGRTREYFYMGASGDGGYQAYIFVPQRTFSQTLYRMMPTTIAAIAVFGVMFSVIVILLLKNIVGPIRIFEEEIRRIQQGDLEIRGYKHVGIPEYDHLLRETTIMKEKIAELLVQQEIEQHERAKLRVEQLMYKINPHFLMNALNTIHWLAVERNTEEINRVARALNKLLYYNLKVDKNTVCLREELEAVAQYVFLQQSRFSFQYVVNVLEEKAYAARIPRFILQPIVENAIYHGMHENGNLVLLVDVMDKLDIYIKNDGDAMEPEMLENLREEVKKSRENSRLGIGLNYVIQILRERYDKEAQIQMLSIKGEGTVIYLSIPFKI